MNLNAFSAIHSVLHCQFIGYKLIVQIYNLYVVIIQQYKNQHQKCMGRTFLKDWHKCLKIPTIIIMS